MNTVKSKYKNPDKYVERLKDEISRQNSSLNYWKNEHRARMDEIKNLKDDAFGEYWFTYSDPGAELTVNLISHEDMLDRINLGQEVICFGSIESFKRGYDKNSAKFLIKKVYVKGV